MEKLEPVWVCCYATHSTLKPVEVAAAMAAAAVVVGGSGGVSMCACVCGCTREIQMKTLNIFYLVIYWKQKVHNDFICLFSLHCIPHKCYSASEVHEYL